MNLNPASPILPIQSPLTRFAPRCIKGVQSTILAAFLSLALLTPATATDFSGNLKGVSITDAANTNKPPVTAFTFAVNGNIINFDASASIDSDGTITTHEWDFGDGSAGSGPQVQHTYNTRENIFVTLTTKDNNNGIALYQQYVNFNNCSSTASYSYAGNSNDTGWWQYWGKTGTKYTGSNSYNICSIDFFISSIHGDLAGKTIYVQIYTLSGANLGKKLGEKQLVVSNLTTGWNHVVFDTSISTGSSGFAIVITPTGVATDYLALGYGGDTGNWVVTRWSNAGTYETAYSSAFSLKIYE